MEGMESGGCGFWRRRALTPGLAFEFSQSFVGRQMKTSPQGAGTLLPLSQWASRTCEVICNEVPCLAPGLSSPWVRAGESECSCSDNSQNQQTDIHTHEICRHP